MNMLRTLTISGIFGVMLATASSPVFSSEDVREESISLTDVRTRVLKLWENEIGKFWYQVFSPKADGKKFSIEQSTDGLEGYNPESNSTRLDIFIDCNKYKPDGLRKSQVCGYDEGTQQIIPIPATVNQSIFLGQVEALESLLKHSYGSQNNIFERLGLTETHRLLWQTPFGTPELGLFEITGLCVLEDKIEDHPLNLMAFDFADACTQHQESFVPRVFTVSYDEFTKICEDNPDLDPLKSIDQLMTYKRYKK